VELSFTENVTPRKLRPNTTLELFGAGMRAAYMKISEEKPFEVKVKRAGEEEWTDVPPARAEADDPTENSTAS
jgi:hypothetical protein